MEGSGRRFGAAEDLHAGEGRTGSPELADSGRPVHRFVCGEVEDREELSANAKARSARQCSGQIGALYDGVQLGVAELTPACNRRG